jgi:DnaJ-class molecular chaperone
LGILIAVAAVAAALVVLDLSVRVWPWRACGKCKGKKTVRSPTGRAWRKCTRCSGRGEQRRRTLAARVSGRRR